jgi:hypothetical protein
MHFIVLFQMILMMVKKVRSLDNMIAALEEILAVKPDDEKTLKEIERLRLKRLELVHNPSLGIHSNPPFLLVLFSMFFYTFVVCCCVGYFAVNIGVRVLISVLVHIGCFFVRVGDCRYCVFVHLKSGFDSL